jgi:uncharacterized membrane-anchored protein YitT (DUF2179 family)
VSTPVGRFAQTFKQVIFLAAGVVLFVIAIRGLILPQKLLTGGVTGLSLLLHALLGWKIGLLVLIFNIPIFLLGFRDLGRRFALYSGMAVVGFWLLVDHLPMPVLTHDPLLASIFGGLLGGVGSALAVRAGGSLGGFDILGVVLNRRFSLGVGEVGLILNGTLIVAVGLIEDPERAMYTLVSIYVGSRTLDALQTPRPRKAVLIVSKENRAIKERLLFEMGRGVTLLKAEGAYTGEDINVLICVITRFELKELRDIVKGEDPQAFVSVLEASDVVGRFRRPSAFSFLKRHPGEAPEV